MEFKCLTMLVLGFLMLCEGCLEEERVALSRLKPFFPFIDYYTTEVGGPRSDYYFEGEYYGSVEEKESPFVDCCKWERVECNPTTGRLTHLFLNLSHIDYDWYDYEYNTKSWYLNASLFLPFEELQFLSLSGNGIAGCVADQGFERLSSRLNKLEILDLSDNYFNDSILASISELSSLKSLSLQDNQFTNGINMLSKLNNLETLNLSWNSLGNTILSQLHDFTSLKSLNLQVCGLKGSVNLLGFDTLTNLKELYLGDNEIEGIESSFQELRLKNLSVLDLSNNPLDNSILATLGKLLNLKTLSLGFSQLKGSINTTEIDGFINLEELDISCFPVGSPGEFPSLKHLELFECVINPNFTLEDPLGLKKLETLSIDSSFLGNNFLDKIGAMPSLKILRISECGLNGTLHTQGFCGLTNLREFDVNNNNLKGNLPECLSNFISLRSLNLSSNQFLGNVSALKALTSLKVLSLSNNYFQIPSSLGPFFGHSKLKIFQADNNTVYVESEMQSSVPRFQLNKISLSCCGDAGEVPQFLYYQRDLWYVDLSNINLKGRFPYWLLQNNTNLQSLYLANNSLQGHFELSFPPLTDLSGLDISKNSINGNVPIEIGVKLPSLSYLNTSRNHFHGSIPASIGDMNSLEYLDLSHNQLSGGLPEHLAMGCYSLSSLILSNNSLQGQMFSSKFNLTNLSELRLDGNHFSGKIPNSLSNCSWLLTLDVSNNELVGGIARWMENMSFLSTLDLSNNQLSGEIPRWMGSMSSLTEIVMAQNHLEGPFPEEFCNLYLLQLLDLSGNNVSGHIPSCFSPLWLVQVHLSRNKLQGPLSNAFRDSTVLVTLDLNNNQLTGKIPNWIANFSQLSFLLLNNNHFEGRIPVQLCNLGHLSLIDLSNNNLSGTIPSCLKITTWNEISQEYARYLAHVGNVNTSFSIDEPIEFTSKNKSYSYKGRVLTYLSGIDLSCNKLTGEIPRQVKNFGNIYALNLSHNSLIGPIPLAFSDLKQIESLDLSHNNLSGTIPPQLVGLTSLSYFSVAYNNLSGNTPVMTAQFSTFEESSYVGNPFLCGKPLPKNCTTFRPSSLPMASNDNGLMDMTAFYASFGASYVVVILSIASVLYINPYWRRAWFYYVGEISKRCYYFLEDHILPKRFHCGN
ncbi:receptor like protein 9 [Hibiscus trionum]|uniref:Receptor like protein 9 n=1 Tax=Hibiscus trionum TaxID=183268 RepID=A0A9W7LXZ1_HIBTR|nr:receptor like protein 9 [Hibiscus trionum]